MKPIFDKTVPTLLISLLFSAGSFADEICPDLEKVTRSWEGLAANGESSSPQLSADGNTLAFISEAQNLDSSAEPPSIDIFLLDRSSGNLQRVTKSTTGSAANGSSGSLDWLSLSADGQHIAFTSDATNMVEGDGIDEIVDVYVWHRQTDTIEKVTKDFVGGSTNDDAKWPSISGDGRYVVFESRATDLTTSDTNGNVDIFIWDGNTGVITMLTRATDGAASNGTSKQPFISTDATTVAFITDATNLAGDNGYGYAYVLWDATLDEFELIAVGAIASYGKALAISADGGQAAFRSSTPLNPGDSHRFGTGIYHWERTSGTYTLVTQPTGPWVYPYGSASPWFRNSDTVTLYGSQNLILESFVLTGNSGTDTYVKDVDFELTSEGGDYAVTRLPAGEIPSGGQTQASFETTEYGVDGESFAPSISPAGRFVGFASFAKTMIEGDEGPAVDADGFVWDGDTGELEKLTWNTSGEQANSGTFEVSLSTGAGVAALTSYASDLVAGDTNDGYDDIFLGAPCIGVPEPTLALLQFAAMASLLGLRSSQRFRSIKKGR